ncbi:MAG: ShlB/FhaC/HecB family hemolysin secretion/activation protein [Steroidobacteraceae bacterium]
MLSRFIILGSIHVCLATLMVGTASAQEAPATVAADNRFNINEFRILGNTTLSAINVETTVFPYLGDNKTIADVEQVRQVLEKLYKDKGYGAVYVDIPEQSVDSGVVRLKVTEGKLDRVRITGARYFANGKIREKLIALTPGTVLNLPELQAQLGEVNSQARDRVITPVLKAGRSPGTVDMELKVQDNLPFHGSVELNDRYSANTTKTRASVNLSYDNLFQKFHSLSFQYQTSPTDLKETRVLAATYLAPLKNGNLLAVYAVDTNSDFAVVSTGGDLSVLGAGNIYGLRYIVRLPVVDRYSQNVTLGADYKNFADNIVLADGAKDTTPIRYMTWSAAYGGTQTRDSSTTGFNLGANLGLRGVVNDQAQFSYKRYQGKANFFYMRGDANHTQSLWGNSAVFLRATGQYSLEPLISNEQFATGGADGVRGYLESAQLADSGLSFSLELRSPSLHQWLGSWAQQWMLFAFYDAAHMQQIYQRIENGVAYDSSVKLSSVGAGMRFAGFSGLEASLDWAYALRPLGEIGKGDSRIHFKVRYAF